MNVFDTRSPSVESRPPEKRLVAIRMNLLRLVALFDVSSNKDPGFSSSQLPSSSRYSLWSQNIRRQTPQISVETESLLVHIINEIAEEQQRLLVFAKERPTPLNEH